ncbi:MAG TPA: hypothetical protein VGS27_29715 [Candidatus Sulfotelmatobacter sp.]|nr:hypothetical protein [Candidatus Sulfotelmatobacter sp.]
MPDEDGERLHARSGRLSPIERKQDLYPLYRAHDLDWCLLYWIPVSSFPIPSGQRQWLMTFLDRLTSTLVEKFGLRLETFLQYKVLYPKLMKAFVSSAVEFRPVPGLGRKPGAKLPAAITEQDIQDMLEGKKYDFNDWVADYSYWFVTKATKKQRELFLGYGGMTTLFLKADSNATPPILPITKGMRKHFTVFQSLDVDAAIAHTFALKDAFQQKSKQLFGDGLSGEPQFQGLRFILPLLGTQDFFSQPTVEREKWFELFDVYVNESSVDKGIIIATRLDLEQHLIDLVKQLTDEGTRYPERT